MLKYILFLLLLPAFSFAQVTFPNLLQLNRDMGNSYEGDEANVLDKLQAYYVKGFMLESHEFNLQAGLRSDTFTLADLNGDAINEQLIIGFGQTTFQNRKVPLVVTIVTTDNLNQYLQWIRDAGQAFERNTYEPHQSIYTGDTKRQLTSVIVHLPYVTTINNPPSRLKRKTTPNKYTLVISTMRKPIVQ